ncbi:MAG TPA: LacI family DNA-binding transcriptional regulator, partial [Microlunatus sp.]|nr:LacI family DNA-binding transcriptional regulator [Microlunatus sp.]
MATMRDVAERAGVSIATVSFVVNNSKPVSAATRERIEAAMAELGFRRNVVARALASRRTRILALAYPALEHRLSTSAVEFITSAAREASRHGYHLVVWPVSNDSDELADLVGQGLVDGVLLMEVQLDDRRVGLLQSLGMPFALIGRTEDTTGLDYVDIDFDTSLELCIDHLWELGHRRIALISGDQRVPSFERYGPYVRMEEAYRRLSDERGFAPVVLGVRSGVHYGRKIAAELTEIAPEITGVVIFDEPAAAGLVAGLHALGRRVPRDVSVISAIAAVDMAYACDPPLTAVSAPGVELGQLAVEALVRRLEGR